MLLIILYIYIILAKYFSSYFFFLLLYDLYTVINYRTIITRLIFLSVHFYTQRIFVETINIQYLSYIMPVILLILNYKINYIIYYLDLCC